MTKREEDHLVAKAGLTDICNMSFGRPSSRREEAGEQSGLNDRVHDHPHEDRLGQVKPPSERLQWSSLDHTHSDDNVPGRVARRDAIDDLDMEACECKNCQQQLWDGEAAQAC